MFCWLLEPSPSPTSQETVAEVRNLALHPLNPGRVSGVGCCCRCHYVPAPSSYSPSSTLLLPMQLYELMFRRNEEQN